MAIITKNFTDGSSVKLFDVADAGTDTNTGMIPAPMAVVGSFMVLVRGPTVFTTVITIWASNHPEPDVTTDTDWEDISAAISDIPTITTIGSDVNHIIQIPTDECGALYYRLKSISSAGTADLAATATFKKIK